MELKFNKGSQGNELRYPITTDQISNLTDCDLVSVRVGEKNGLRNPLENRDIEESLQEVIDTRIKVLNGMYPSALMFHYWPFEYDYRDELAGPLLLEGLSRDNPKELADVVHMDWPTDIGRAMLKYIYKECNLKEKTYHEFLGNNPKALEIIAEGASNGLEKGFQSKYYFGIPRPEELYKFLKEGLMVGEDYINITAYPEGCPNHPSFPAGHSSASGGVVARLLTYFGDKLPEYVQEQCLIAAWQWGMFRTFAGVHYAWDNVAGFLQAIKPFGVFDCKIKDRVWDEYFD